MTITMLKKKTSEMLADLGTPAHLPKSGAGGANSTGMSLGVSFGKIVSPDVPYL